MMRRSAGFDADEARRQPLKEWQNVPALELTANDYITCRVNSVDLKNRLGDIETDCRDRLHVWLLRIVGALTAPTSMALPCRWRSRPQHHKRTLPPFAERKVMECGRDDDDLFRLDVGSPDYLGPLLGFVGDELAEVAGRAWKHGATKVGKARLHLGIGEALIDLLVQLINDLRGCALRSADPKPATRLIARQELAHGRDVRQRVRARRGRYRQRAQSTRPHLLDRFDNGGEHDLHLTGDEIGDRGAAATIGHMNHIDAGHGLEQLARQVQRGALPSRRHGGLTRLALSVSDELGHRRGQNSWRHYHHARQ